MQLYVVMKQCCHKQSGICEAHACTLDMKICICKKYCNIHQCYLFSEEMEHFINGVLFGFLLFVLVVVVALCNSIKTFVHYHWHKIL